MAIRTDDIRLKKGGKKARLKKEKDPYAKKEWFTLVAPPCFSERSVGKTIVSKSNTLQQTHKKLIGRTFEINQGDLNPGNEEGAIRNFKFMVGRVNGTEAIGHFHSMAMTTDKQKGMVKKWHTLIEAVADAKTSDGYQLRFLISAITRKHPLSTKKTAYVNRNTVKDVRKTIFETVSELIEGQDIISAMKKMCTDEIAITVSRKCETFCPLQVCHTIKVNTLRKPKFE
ncbi:40S ribosomal protein S1 [Dictyocoela muelleri]|nr:40S ribosomal protein S1 [Dictyocoela muelleri]